jgi:hypothetical protein
MNENGESPNEISTTADPPGPGGHFRDIAPAIEFACWVVVVLAPILRLINGAAVTTNS